MYDGSIVNAKELEALQHEIASLKERRSRAEDAMLEQMATRRGARTRAAGRRRGARAARAKVEAVGGDAIGSSTRSRPS